MQRALGYSSSSGTQTKTSPRPSGARLAPIGGVRRPSGKLPPMGTTSKALTDEQRTYAKTVFDTHDTNGSGEISKDELKNMLIALEMDIPSEVLESYTKMTMSSADKDFSGALSFEEFLGVYSAIMYESRSHGFSFAAWKKSKK